MNDVATRPMQGAAIPVTSVNDAEFFARTRRNIYTEKSGNFAGLGNQDIWELRKTGIISEVRIRFTGSLTVTPNTGTVASTHRWPHDLPSKVRFTANGASNLINCSGGKLKAHAAMGNTDQDDRGVSQNVGGATVNQGTLALASESWGVGSGETAIAAGTYDVDLEWTVPVAEDQVDLTGSIFAATSSTSIDLSVDWNRADTLFALTADATVDLTGTYEILPTRYTIPQGADGQIVVPDLSLFHSLIETPTGDLSTGLNELKMMGQGQGMTLLRMFSQVWSGNPSAPLAVNATNFGRMGYRYSTNETPDEFPTGQALRSFNEQAYNVDIGKLFGFWCHDFAIENSFRDAVDLGTMSEFRQLIEILNGANLTAPKIEVVAETLFAAGAGS